MLHDQRTRLACLFFSALLAAGLACQATSDEPLPLPDTASEPRREIKLGEHLALDDLGPLIVAADGSLRRIANWAALSEAERATALRRLGQRNRQRLATLEERQQFVQQQAQQEL